MKKLLFTSICICLAFSLSGCSLGKVLDRFIEAGDVQDDIPLPDKPRVYMDEIQGRIQDFTGNQLTLLSEKESYTFDVSQAALECKNGIITGDEISVIYEGQLDGTNTSQVRALKVVDEFNQKNHLEDRTAHGQVQSLTPNTITIKAKNGKTATYPITGTQQYYQNGVKPGGWVYIHFKGKFPVSQEKNLTHLDASHLKVASVSDIDPLSVPAPTPTPTPEEAAAQTNPEKLLGAVIQDINLNSLQVLPDGSQTSVVIDLSAIPSHFKGGAAPGSRVDITYTGEFNGATLEGMNISAVTGQDPETLSDRHITFTVTGTIVGSTANTATIQTGDGALVTCITQGVTNSSTGGMLSGSSITATFNPAKSRQTNLYTCLKIQDA